MALHGSIEVNETMIGRWEATRVPVDFAPTPNTHLTYKCYVHILATLEGNPEVSWRGEVTHRFGDGALALAAKVLQVAQQSAGIAL